MSRLLTWIFVAVSFGACAGGRHEQRIVKLEDSMAMVQRDQALAASRLDESNRLNQTVFLLQDRIEQMGLDLERMQSGVPETSDEFSADQPEELPAEAPVAAPIAAKPAPVKVAAVSKATGDPVSMYRKAYDSLKKGAYAEAKSGFGELLERFPDHEYSDNAQYWLGETDYAQKNYRHAVTNFQRVVDQYPGGNKVPDALLKMAYCHQLLGDKVKAREILQKIVDTFPWSEPAKKAKERLGTLGRAIIIEAVTEDA